MPTWNSAFAATPSGGAPIGEGDDRIRELKTAIYERLVKELVMDLSSGLAAEDGWLKSGASKIYVGESEPTTRPDGTTALTEADYGRLWYNTSDTQLYVYTSSGWITLPLVAEATHAGSAASVDTLAPHAIVKLVSGSGNWTVPDGVTRIKVTCVGGGGGGGGGGSTGGGGGGGTNISDVIPSVISVTPGETRAYAVGSGGAGGGSSLNGSNGGSTTFSGATTGSGGSGGGAGVSGGYGGRGGLGSTGGAGSAGGVASGYLGGSGGGAGGRGGISDGASGSAGGYGGGGGGGAHSTGSGGAGGSGIIIIEY